MFLPSSKEILHWQLSTAKFISLIVQIYLAGLEIANSFEKKLRLTAKENHVAWHYKLDEGSQNK